MSLSVSKQTEGFEFLEYFIFDEHYPPIHPLRGIRFFTPKSSWWLDADVWIWVVVFAIGASILRYICFHTIFKYLAELWTLREKDIVRFYESAWQFAFYLPVSIIQAVALLDEQYFYETWRLWEDPFPHLEMDESTWWIFVMEMGWYLHCLYSALFLDKRKSDFVALMLHHAVTIPLIGFSMCLGYHRIGLIVMFTHDVCDVFLHICKILRYVDNVHPFNEVFKVLMFATVPISWFAFRLVLFPWKAIYPAVVLAPYYGGWINVDGWAPFGTGLVVLWILQLYWFYLIAHVAWEKIRHGEFGDDIREKKE